MNLVKEVRAAWVQREIKRLMPVSHKAEPVVQRHNPARAARKWLESAQPLMVCGPLIEFRQRLQWLSEGMLKNHTQTHGHNPCPQEQADYRTYKEML